MIAKFYQLAKMHIRKRFIMRYFVKCTYHGKNTIYEQASYLEALRFTQKWYSTPGMKTVIYTDKGDSSKWNKATWNEFYTDLTSDVYYK